jgi:hypothetical protein
VTLHIGDSHELLPQVLRQLEREGRNVDFALIDGDHSTEGVRRDVEDLLGSGAVRRSILLMHDTMNEYVRAGLESFPFERYASVTYVDLDCVPGYLLRAGEFRNELWGGLGLLLVGHESPRADGRVREDSYGDAHRRLLARRDELVQADRATDGHRTRSQGSPLIERLGRELEHLRRERNQLQDQLGHVHHAHTVIAGSRSWRATAPLRTAMHLVRRLRRRQEGRRS